MQPPYSYDEKFVSGQFYLPPAGTYQPYQAPLSPASRRPEVIVPTVPIIEPELDNSERRATDRGPRSCFLLTALVAVVVAGAAAFRGTPALLYKGVNLNGLICGVDAPVIDMPYVYYPLSGSNRRPDLLLDEPQCVSACPGLKDVGRTLDVPMSQLEKDPSSGSSVVVQFRVHTPMYATRQVADYLCLPLEESLKNQVVDLYQGLGRQIVFGLGTSKNAWPAILLSTAASLGFGGLAFVVITKHAPWVVPALTAPLWPALLAVSGCYCLWFSAAKQVPSIFVKCFPATFTSSALLGVMLLLSAVKAASIVTANWPLFGIASNAYKSAISPLWNSNTLPVSAAIAAAASALTALYFDVLRSVISSAPVSATEESLAINENGGVTVVPLHRAIHFFSFGVVFTASLWTIFSAWAVATLISLNRFVAAYAGATWYFSDPTTCGCRTRDVGWCPALIGADVALKYHLGSLALAAVAWPLSTVRQVASFATTRLNPQYFDIDPARVAPAVPDASVQFTDMVAWFLGDFIESLSDVVDFTTSAVFSEIALQSFKVSHAVRTARHRLLGSGPRTTPSLAAPYVGVGGIVTMCVAGCLSAMSFLACFALLTGPSDFDLRQMAKDSGISAPARGFFDFTSPDSVRFVSSPLYPAFIAGAISFVGVYVLAEAHEVTSDAMFYGFILESDGFGDDYQGPRVGVVVEHPCDMRFAPEDVKTLLVEALEAEQAAESMYQ